MTNRFRYLSLLRFRHTTQTKSLSVILFFTLNSVSSSSFAALKVDVCVYGSSSAGVIAAYTAKKMGKSVIIIEPGKHVGGLSSSGLGYTDIGNKYAISGLAWDFYRRIGKHYARFEQWIFEPHVAEKTFLGYLNEAKVEVLYEHRLVAVQKASGVINSITIESFINPAASHKNIEAKAFIDCSYEGDLMAKAGVSYTVGREANQLYKETFNGVQLMKGHQFPDGIDPYIQKGDPSSGLLWGISPAVLPNTGSGDKKVQAYNFRICLTNDPNNRIAITRPDNYNPSRYELLLRFIEKVNPKSLHAFLKIDHMPNKKTDINNNGPFSTDMIGENYDFPEADYNTRKAIEKKHVDYTKGLLYFIGHDERMPKHLRDMMLQWGYPKDEYTDNGNWSHQLYVREARRMIGEYVMTQANCEGREVVKDKIGMAAYTMDSHNCQRLVVNGMVKNEGNVEAGGFGPYPIAYRSIVPKKAECKNLLVPVCMSASHIAYGSIRMEPVFMVLAQSAAVAASLSIDSKKPVQEIDIDKLMRILKENPIMTGSTVEILVDNEDAEHVTVKGEWTTDKKASYGPTLLQSKDNKSEKSVRYTPEIKQAGKYNVFVYIPKLKELANELPLTIKSRTKTDTIQLKLIAVEVKGQTSGEWVSAGTYDFAKGKKSFIEISNKNTDGQVIADAVLFIPAGK